MRSENLLQHFSCGIQAKVFSRRQKIHLVKKKLKQCADYYSKKHSKKNYLSHRKKLEALKEHILSNPQKYYILPDKHDYFDGNEFDVSLKLLLKDNRMKFYQIQLIKYKRTKIIAFISRGIVGDKPVFQIKLFNDLLSSTNFFKSKFSRKKREGYERSDYTFLKQFRSENNKKKLIKTYLISQLF